MLDLGDVLTCVHIDACIGQGFGYRSTAHVETP